MTYLELCKAVRSRIGMQGTGPATVLAPVNLEADIVHAVYDAWIDIQNYRSEWDWMRATASFDTVAGTTNYTKTTVGGSSHRIHKFVKGSLWLNDGSTWAQPRYQDEDRFEYLQKNNTTQTTPGSYTINRNDESIEIELPDDAYSCTIDYYKTPQELTLDASEPEFDDHWHLLIVYLAIQKLSASIASASTQVEYSQAYAEMMGQLMRTQLKKKKIVTVSIA